MVRHSSVEYDAFYKIAGVWSGGKGSLLLWTWFIGIALVIEEAFQWRKHRADGGADEVEVYDWARLFGTAVLVAMLFLLVDLGLFAKTSPFVLASAAGRDGFGLNPLLETPMVIIHPPLEFAGYALVTIPFAAALAFLITRSPRWTEISLQWGRVAWVFYTAAITMGGIWAYTVLGWGGYWGWDPVETVNLIAWIALTGFVHAQLYHRQRKKFIWIAPLLGILAFVLTIFATFETRTGYVDSVHTFTSLGDEVAPAATEKLLKVLAAEPSGPFLMALMFASLFGTAILFLWRFHQIRSAEAGGDGPAHLWVPRVFILLFAALLVWAVADVVGFLTAVFAAGGVLGGGNADLGTVVLALIVGSIPIAWVLLTSREEEEERPQKSLVNDDSTMTVAIAIFSLWFFVTLALMLLGINGMDPAVFEARLPLIVIPLGMVLVAALAWRELGPENLLILLAILTVLTVLFYFFLEPGRFWVYIPVAAAAIGISIFGIVRAMDSKLSPTELRIAGGLLLASGVMGMVMWGTFPTTTSIGPAVVEVSPLLALVMFLLSLVVQTGAAFATRARNLKASAVVGLLGILTIGYYVGAVLAVGALVLIARTAMKKEDVRVVPIGRTRPAVRRAAAHVIHLGVALVLLAYAASTFLPTAAVVSAPAGVPTAESLGYSFVLTGATGEDEDGDGQYERVTAHVEIYRDEVSVGHGDLLFWWMETMGAGSPPHYMPGVDVTVLPLEDIYLIPLSFGNEADGTIPAQGTSGLKATSTDLDAVAFEVRVNPLVGVLWAGVWMMSGALIVRVVADHWRPPLRKESIPPAPAPGPAPTLSYEQRLEEELGAPGG